MKNQTIANILVLISAVIVLLLSNAAMGHTRGNWFSDRENVVILRGTVSAPYVNYTPKPRGYECIRAFGRKICGYHCIKTSMSAACAAHPAQACIANVWGQVACGWRCMRHYGNVYCTVSRFDTCVQNRYGQIKCGLGCRYVNARVVCAKARYVRCR